MRRSGIIMLAVALLLGLVSVFLAKGWLAQQARHNPATVQGLETSTVVIARRSIAYGDEIRPDYLAEIQWPSSARPDGVFTTIKEILDGKSTRVALRSIEANEPLLRTKVSGFGQKATLSAVIDGHKRAVTIRVNEVIGVAGFVLPGDRVDVLLTRQDSDKNYQSDVVLQNLRVLGIDQEANDAKDKPSIARAVTLEVTTQEAQKLALAGEVGSLTLALRNGTGDGALVDSSTVRVRDLTRMADAKSPSKSRFTTVHVVRAMKSTPTEVHPERY